MVSLDSSSIPGYVIDAARALVKTLQSQYACPPGTLDRIYYHWTVAPHNVLFKDYNLEVVLRNGVYQVVVTHDPRDNAEGVNNNSPASHTEHRNTGAIGISIDGMDGSDVSIHDFGADGPNQHCIWMLCAAGAAVAKAYGIDASGKVSKDRPHLDDTNSYTVHTVGEPIIATHAEAAVWDNYPADRWDLGVVNPLPEGETLTPAMRTQTANGLRALTHAIKAKL